MAKNEEEARAQKALAKRLRARERKRGRGYHSALHWDGKTYGYGAGRAHPCVEFVRCPHCKQRIGQLCKGSKGVKFDTHYVRRGAYQRLVSRLRCELRQSRESACAFAESDRACSAR